MPAFYDLAWRTWVDNLGGSAYVTKLWWANTQGHIFIISSVLCTDGNDSYEQLVCWEELGSKCLDA